MRCLKISKHRAMRIGCNVDFEDELLWNHQRRYILEIDWLSNLYENQSEYQGHEEREETGMRNDMQIIERAPKDHIVDARICGAKL